MTLMPASAARPSAGAEAASPIGEMMIAPTPRAI
jgi:hypothetical protein